MGSELKPYTGSWACPLCSAHIPITVYGRAENGSITFVPSPWPMADVHWHIESEHPEGKD